MKDKYFIDTNIVVYSFDESVPNKQKTAQAIINEALSTGHGVVSYQVIQEFLNVSTRKFKVPFRLLDAKLYLEEVLIPLCEVYSDPALFHQALDIQAHTQFSFYDSLIVAGAMRSGCHILYSEDLQHDRKIDKLIIKNPFASS
jgi:predicted nucleic acid-binding protein